MNKEEKAALVKKYCNENTKPKQDLCPEVNQYIRTSKGYEIWNSKDFSREPIDFDPTRYVDVRKCCLQNVVCVRSEYEGLYIEYHKEMDALEFAHIFMDGGRGKDGEAKEWYYGNGWNYSRYFIFRNDSNAYSNIDTLTGNGHYSKYLLSEMKSWARRSLVGEENYEEFKKFVPNSNELREYNHWYRTPLAQIWQYARWYQMEFIPRSKSKTVSEIENYEFEDIKPNKLTDNDKQAYFEILDDKYAVLRIYKFPNSWEARYGENTHDAREVARLFISAKGKPTLMVKEDSWKIKASTPWNACGYLLFVNISELSNWKPLKYIIPCLDLYKTGVDELVNILRHPIIEQLSKAGYPNIARKLQNNCQIAQDLKKYFSVEKEKKLPMFKLLGVNKFALNAAERHEGNLNIIREIKFFMGGFDATEASEEVCNYIADYVGGQLGYWSKSITDIIPGYVSRYDYRGNSKYATPLTDEQRKWILKIFRMESKQAGCIELFDDVVKTYNRLHEERRPDVDIYNVKSYDDIHRLHDALVELKIQQDREDQALRNASERERQAMLQKKFEKLQKDRIEKFEYEDDNFCIRVPHELNEITREGICLHHCVGGYLDRHAQGGTNILFLRRKADENTPFYTIEINNNDTVVQIHGSHNKWLGNDPDAVPFVYKYLNKIGAGFDRKILLNKGAGYSAGIDSLPESYLEAV